MLFDLFLFVDYVFKVEYMEEGRLNGRFMEFC